MQVRDKNLVAKMTILRQHRSKAINAIFSYGSSKPSNSVAGEQVFVSNEPVGIIGNRYSDFEVVDLVLPMKQVSDQKRL